MMPLYVNMKQNILSGSNFSRDLIIKINVVVMFINILRSTRDVDDILKLKRVKSREFKDMKMHKKICAGVKAMVVYV